MTEYTFEQLVDMEQVQQLLHSLHRLSGMTYAVLDADGNIYLAVGWQEICERFHRINPVSCGRCRESDAFINERLHDFDGEFIEYRCKNGMMDVAMPIIISGKHLASFYAGQFFYDDDRPDTAYFSVQAEELGFDRERYLASLERVPVFSREYVRNNLIFLRDMVAVLSETGLKNLRITRETEERERIEKRLSLTGFALDYVREAAFLMDEQGRLHYVNQEACRSLGFSMDELLGMSILDIDPDFSPESLSKGFARLHEKGSVVFETSHRARDGRIFPVEITATLFEYDGALHTLALARDITKRRQNENAVRTSRDYLENIINAIADPVFVKDEDHRLVLVNDAECALAGGTREELLGKTEYDFFPKEQADLFWEIDNRVLANGEPDRNEQLVTDAAGRIRTVITHKSRYVDPQGNRFVVGVIRDITKRKELELAQSESEKKFRTLTENSPNIIVRYDRECRRIYVNPAYSRKSGISVERSYYSSPAEQWHEYINLTAEEYTAKLRQVMETGVSDEVLLEWQRPDTGHISNHVFNIVAERDMSGGIAGCLAIGHDISRLKQAELRLAKLAEMVPGVLYNYLLEPDGSMRMPYVSPRIEVLGGISPDELAAEPEKVFALVHPDDRPRLQESILESARRLDPWHLEFRAHHPLRGEVWVEGHSIPERQQDGGILWYGFLHDITERKRIEEMLRAKREQLAAMAIEISLAEERERLRIAAVLHDHIGQTLLLCRIKLGALAGVPKSGPLGEVIDEVGTLLDQATDEAHSLTVQLNPPILSMSGLEHALQWLGNRMESDYGLLVEFSDDQRPKKLRDELRSVLYQCARELLINCAKHADTDRAWLRVGLEDGMYRLTVEDRGTGFNPDDIVPDFSRDCRFGLFSIQMRIERMGGRMEIESFRGSGTRITIRLPSVTDRLHTPL
jgi:PAS domain S-box-containing protein